MGVQFARCVVGGNAVVFRGGGGGGGLPSVFKTLVHFYKILLIVLYLLLVQLPRWSFISMYKARAGLPILRYQYPAEAPQ